MIGIAIRKGWKDEQEEEYAAKGGGACGAIGDFRSRLRKCNEKHDGGAGKAS